MHDMTETIHAPARSEGLSRRRIIQGVAWTTPAVLIATAAPALAASGAPSATAQLVFTQAEAVQRDNQWTGSGHVKAVSVAFRVQNQGNGSRPVDAITVTFKVPGAANPGSPNVGFVYGDAGWVYSTTVSGGDLVVVATYSGRMNAWGNSGAAIWVELKKNAKLVGTSLALTAQGTPAEPGTIVTGATAPAPVTAG